MDADLRGKAKEIVRREGPARDAQRAGRPGHPLPR